MQEDNESKNISSFHWKQRSKVSLWWKVHISKSLRSPRTAVDHNGAYVTAIPGMTLAVRINMVHRFVPIYIILLEMR